MAKAVTLADIAKEVGVSTVTVSKALSGQTGVSDKMREQIHQVAGQLGYIYASGQKIKNPVENYHIGVLLNKQFMDGYDSFYWKMYQELSAAAMNQHCYCQLEIVDPMQKSNDIPAIIRERQVDGICIVGEMDEQTVKKIAEYDIPIVSVDHGNYGVRADSVVSDNYSGGYAMTRYLLDKGHRRIGYVGTVLATDSITDRYMGYQKALMEQGVEVRKDWILSDRRIGENLIMEECMKLPQDMPDAFFCNCDLTAAILIQSLEKKGYRVPEDVSIAGYDNYSYPGMCNVALTTYQVDIRQMAEQAVSLLYDRISQGDDMKPVTRVVEGILIEKDSVRAIERQ